MIFRENGIGNGCRTLEIEFQENDTFCEKQVAYKGFDFIKSILQLHREEAQKTTNPKKDSGLNKC